jgi:predicted nucleic acid-binding protein
MLPAGTDVYIKGMIPILNCGILRYPMTEGLARQASTYIRKGLTGYDACYVSLAKDVGGKWLTFDEKAHNLIKSARLSHALSKSLPEGWEA